MFPTLIQIEDSDVGISLLDQYLHWDIPSHDIVGSSMWSCVRSQDSQEKWRIRLTSHPKILTTPL